MKISKFYKLILFICISSFPFICLQGQTIQWQKALGGTGEETMDGDKLIKQTPDGGYIVAGTTGSNPFGGGDVTFLHGGYDYWVVKLSSNGNIQWQKTYGSSSSEFCHGISLTSDGGYILVGESYLGNDGDVTGNQGLQDYWVVKIDSIGNLQWQRSLGGSNPDAAWAVDEAPDGSFYITGESESNDGNVSGNHGGDDGWVVKLSSIGTLLWQRAIGGSDLEKMRSIVATDDGGCIVGGSTASDNGDVSGNHGSDDFWLVKLSSNDSLEWQKCFGGSGQEFANSVPVVSVTQTSDGGFAIGGMTTSTDGDVTGYHGMGDIWIVKTDSLGNLQWQKCLGGSGGEEMNSIVQTSDGGFAAIGYTASADGDITVGNYGWIDYFVFKIDSVGTLRWQIHLGGSDTDLPSTIIQSADGGYMVGGRSQSNDFDVTGNHGNGDYWIVKLSQTVGMAKAIMEDGISIYPNPNNGKFMITFNAEQKNAKLKITDVLGNTIRQTDIVNQQSEIDISTLAKGIYFIQLTDENKNIINKKIIKE